MGERQTRRCEARQRRRDPRLVRETLLGRGESRLGSTAADDVTGREGHGGEGDQNAEDRAEHSTGGGVRPGQLRRGRWVLVWGEDGCRGRVGHMHRGGVGPAPIVVVVVVVGDGHRERV